MSLAHEDWKKFDVLSGQLRIADVTDGEMIFNAENGTWVAMCEYDDDNRISLLVAMHEKVADEMSDGVVEMEGVEEHTGFNSKSGVVFFADRKLGNKVPDWFKVNAERLNPDIVEMYGTPEDHGKTEEDRFIENCFHMARDCRVDMPVLENLGFGAVCELPRGELDIGVLYNWGRDAVGFEITRKGR